MIQNTMTEEQKRDAIVAHVNSNIFVEAGAGAGKTTLIVDRVLNQLKLGAVKAQQLVIITFTNKAAEELYARIEAGLRKALKDNSIAKTEKQCLEEAMSNIENMNISTIHSFCHKLLVEHALEAGLPLDVTLLNNDEEKQWKQRIFDEWFKELSRKQIEEFRACVGYAYKKYLLGAFLDISDLPKEMEIPFDDALLNEDIFVYKNHMTQALEKFYNSVVDVINKYYVLEPGKGFQNVQELINCNMVSAPFKKAYREATIEGSISKLNKIAKESQDGKLTSAIVFKNCKANTLASGLYVSGLSKDDANNLSDECLDVYRELGISELLVKLDSVCYAYLMNAAMQVRDRYWAMKNAQYITNDQLLQKARDLVCKNEVAKEAISKRYTCLYVDEFQDVDSVQADLVLGIAKKHIGGDELRSGSVFLVGDPKQSIYRFRGAEPALYHEIKEIMALSKEDEVYELDYNYRSEEDIINWVNNTFDEARPMVYPKGKLKQTVADSKRIVGVYKYDKNSLLDVACKNSWEKPARQIEEDANQLCKMIRFLVDNEYEIEEIIEDKNAQKVRHIRKIEYRDFLVLAKNTTKMSVYLKKMSAYGIPVQLAGNMKVDANMVLQYYQWLFQYLAQPKNRMYRETALQVLLREEVNESNSELGKHRLEKMRKETKNMSGYGIAHYLLKHIEFVMPWNTDIKEEALLSAQTKLQQMVETVLYETHGEMTEMIEAFDTYRNSKIEREMSLEESPNAIRFMNIHKSKGLEGNIVVVACRNEGVDFQLDKFRFRVRQENAVLQQYYGVLEQASDAKINYNAKKYQGYTEESMIGQKAIADYQAENWRLEYVTATRAIHALIFMNPLNARCHFNSLDLSAQPSITDLMSAGIMTKNNSAKSIVKFVPQEESFEEAMWEQQYISLTPSSLEYNTDTDEKKHQSDETHGEARPKGNVFGTVMHRCFELLMEDWKQSHFEDESIKDRFEQMIRLAILENQHDMKERYAEYYQQSVQDYQTYLMDKMTEFVNNPDMRELLASTQAAYIELPFSFYTSLEQDEAMFRDIEQQCNGKFVATNNEYWINGTADLVLHQNDGSVFVIDYKSDTKGDWSDEAFSKHKDKYNGQLTLYKYAMAKIFEVDPEQVDTAIYDMY